MIGLKEIRRRFNSTETKDVSWVVNTAMAFMAIMGVIILAFVLILS